jgi:hypothetical protein
VWTIPVRTTALRQRPVCEKSAGLELVLLCCQGMLATITIYITVLKARRSG